jgi:hypothetical protein
MKIVRRAATEERTGEVREMSARKAPEKADMELVFHVFFLES